MKKIVLFLSILLVGVLVFSSGCIGNNTQVNNTTSQVNTQSPTHTINQYQPPHTTTSISTSTTTTTTSPNKKTVTKLIYSDSYASAYYVGSNPTLLNYKWNVNSYTLKIKYMGHDYYYTVIDIHNFPRSLTFEILTGVSGYTSNYLESDTDGKGHLILIFRNWESKGKLMNIAFRLYEGHKFVGFFAVVPKKPISMNGEIYANINSIKVLTKNPVTENSTVDFSFTAEGKLFNNEVPQEFNVKINPATSINGLKISNDIKTDIGNNGVLSMHMNSSIIAKYISSNKGKPMSLFAKVYYDGLPIFQFTIKIPDLFYMLSKKVVIKSTTTSNTSVQVINYSGYNIPLQTLINKDYIENNKQNNEDGFDMFTLNNGVTVITFNLKINADSKGLIYVQFLDTNGRLIYSNVIPVVKGVNYASYKFVTQACKDNKVKLVVSTQDSETGKINTLFTKTFTVNTVKKQLPNIKFDAHQDGNNIIISYDGSQVQGKIITVNEIMKELDNAVVLSNDTKLSNILINSNSSQSWHRTYFADCGDGRYHFNHLQELLNILLNKHVKDIGYFNYLNNKEFVFQVKSIDYDVIKHLNEVVQDKIIQGVTPSIYKSTINGDNSLDTYSVIGFMFLSTANVTDYNYTTVKYTVTNKNNVLFYNFMGEGIIAIKNLYDNASLTIKVTSADNPKIELSAFLMGSGDYSDYIFSNEPASELLTEFNFVIDKVFTVNTNESETIQPSNINSGDYFIGTGVDYNTGKISDRIYLIDLTAHYGVKTLDKIPQTIYGLYIMSVLKSKDGHILVEVDDYSNSSVIKDNYGNTINLSNLPKLNTCDYTFKKISNNTYEISINKVYFNNTHLFINVDTNDDYNVLQYITITYNGKQLSADTPELETYKMMGYIMPFFGIKVKDGDVITIKVTNTKKIEDFSVWPFMITDNMTFNQKMDELMNIIMNNDIMKNVIVGQMYSVSFS